MCFERLTPRLRFVLFARHLTSDFCVCVSVQETGPLVVKAFRNLRWIEVLSIYGDLSPPGVTSLEGLRRLETAQQLDLVRPARGARWCACQALSL